MRSAKVEVHQGSEEESEVHRSSAQTEIINKRERGSHSSPDRIDVLEGFVQK